jgi:hypothetical protein
MLFKKQYTQIEFLDNIKDFRAKLFEQSVRNIELLYILFSELKDIKFETARLKEELQHTLEGFQRTFYSLRDECYPEEKGE